MRIYRQCLVFLGLNEKFAVQVRSNVVDKNHMEEKNSNPTSVQCALYLYSKVYHYMLIKYIHKSSFSQKMPVRFWFCHKDIRSLLLDLLLIENIKKLL